jgi:hypothetical protein
MYYKNEFVEAQSSWHYIYSGATPKDQRMLDLFKINFYESNIDETTTANGGTPQSSSTGQYTQPAIWAKNKNNWKGNSKPQYPNGKIVDKTTDGNVSIFETIAKKTGKTIDEVKAIIENSKKV